MERCKEEFEAIQDQTENELKQMLEIEKGHHYLSTGSENEYLFILKLLSDNSDLNNCPDDRLKSLQLTEDTFFVGESKLENSVKTIKNSVHAYWLQLVNRFVSQFHMWVIHNFVS